MSIKKIFFIPFFPSLWQLPVRFLFQCLPVLEISYKCNRTIWPQGLFSPGVVFSVGISVVYISCSFPFMAKQYSLVHTYYILFVYSLMGIYVVSTFRLLWIVLLWTFTYSIWVPVFISLGYIPRSRISESYGNSMFLRNHRTFSKVAMPIPGSSVWEFWCLHIFTNTYCFLVF